MTWQGLAVLEADLLLGGPRLPAPGVQRLARPAKLGPGGLHMERLRRYLHLQVEDFYAFTN